MIKQSLLLSLASFTCLSAITYDWAQTIDNNWNIPGNWNPGGPPTSVDRANFYLLSSSANLSADADVEGLTISGVTTIDGAFDTLVIHPATPTSGAIDIFSNLTMGPDLYVKFNGSGVINNNAAWTLKGIELSTYDNPKLFDHVIQVNNNGTIDVVDNMSLFRGDDNPFLLSDNLLDIVTISPGVGGNTLQLSGTATVFVVLKEAKLDGQHVFLSGNSQLGLFNGTFIVDNSFIEHKPNGTACGISLLTQNKMIFTGTSQISQGTATGTLLIGPTPVEMLSGTIDNNSFFLIDKQKLDIVAGTYIPAPQTSIFSGGTIISSQSTSGQILVAGTAIFNNSVEQGKILCGSRLNVLEIGEYVTGSTSIFPSPSNATAFMYANGNIASDVEVSGSGTLLGNGTITGSVTIGKFGQLNAGTAGAPIGTLKINGNLVFQSNSQATVDVTTSGFDFVNVLTGNLNIVNTGVGTPTLTFNVLGVPPTGTFFPLFEALSGISGQFDVTIPPSLIDFTYNTTDTLIYLSRAFIPVPTSGCAITPNQIAVETALNLLNGNTSACLQEKIDLISELACPIKRAIYDTLEPSEFKGQQIANEEIILAINADLISRMNQKKRGFRPFLHAGYRRLNQNSYSQYSGFHTNAGYQLLGFQRGFENAQIMAALGASEIYNSYKKTSSSSNTQQMIFGLGVAAFTRHFQMNLDGMFASNYNHTTRDIPFYGLKAHSSHGGYTAKGALDLRYRFLSNSGEITPYDTVSYLYDHESGFTEEGAECLNLQVQSSSRQVLRNEAGLHFQAKLQDMIKPYLDLAYVYEHRQGGTNYETNFISTTPLMTIEGIKPSRNYAKLAFGVVGYKGPWGYRLNLDGMYSNKTKQAGGSFALDRRF